MKIVVRDGIVMQSGKEYDFFLGSDAPVFKDKLRITNKIWVYNTAKDYTHRWRVVHREEWIHRCEEMEVSPGVDGFQGVELQLVSDGGWKDS